MSLIHPGILYGLGLALIPVILHLLLRPKPKKLVFPALRLVQSRRKTNVRRLRLRHWWLLLLRIAVLVLIVLAVARPSLPAADYALNARESLALAGIAAAALATYAGTIIRWNRQSLPRHEFAYRRTLLRAGTATGALLLTALFVGWPYAQRVKAELADPTTIVREHVPSAAVFVFDTSLSMEYAQVNRTRLAAAQEVARTHLAQLPGRSRVALLDSSRSDSLSATIFHADRAAAQSRIDRLAVAASDAPLDDALRAAIRLQEVDRERSIAEEAANAPGTAAGDPFHREIYILTDLARSAWRDGTAARLKAELERVPWLQLYLIDAGIESPRNAAITNVRLSQEAVSERTVAQVTAEVAVEGEFDVLPAVELYASPAGGGEPVKLGRALLQPGRQEVAFSLPAAAGILVQGELRLTGSDPFPPDDSAWFTVRVQPRADVLIVSETTAESIYWRTVLEAVDVRWTELRPAQIVPEANLDLARYDAVFLMNVRRPTEFLWQALARYVDAGGGLCVFLGHGDIDERAYNAELPQSLLPGRLVAPRPFRGDPAVLAFSDRNHPLTRPFHEQWGFGDLATRPVFRAWNVTPAENAGVIASLSVGGVETLPAILERRFGRGRTLLFSTAVDRGGWSELPLAGWWFLALADHTVRYISGRELMRFNYIAGEPVTIPIDADPPPARYLLREPGPEGRQVARDVPPGARELRIDPADVARIGQYAILPAADDPSEFHSGFSVNPPPGESDFTRLTRDELDAKFGEKCYQVARDPSQLEAAIHEGRLGREMYPALVTLLLLFFCGEMLVANRFYGSREEAEESRTGRA